MTTIPYDQPGLHPDLIWGHDFDVADMAAFEAQLLADPYGGAYGLGPGHSFENVCGAVVDNVIPFNGHNTLRQNTTDSQNGFRALWPWDGPNFQAMWMRTFVWLPANAITEAQPVIRTPATNVPHWAVPWYVYISFPTTGDFGLLPEWFPQGTPAVDYPAGVPEDMYAVDTQTVGEFYGPMPRANVLGKWFPVVSYAQGADVGNRVRLWGPDGSLVVDHSGGESQYNYLYLIMECFTQNGGDMAFGQFEFVPTPCPYSGLEGFVCPQRPQFHPQIF